MKPSMRITGGNPAGAPNFNPINKWGRMPRRAPPQDHSMWVCDVEDTETRRRVQIGLVGPKQGAEMLAEAVRRMNEKGKCWAADPQVVRVLS